MKRSQLYLLLAVLLLGTFYTWSKVRKLESAEKEYQEARYFPKLEQDDVGRIRVVSADPQFEYELVQKGDAWFIDSHRLSVEKSHQLVSSILELSREREMEASPSSEREAEFGLDTPNYRLTVWDDEGQELGTVKLGQRTPDYNHFYGQWEKGGPISTVPAYTLGPLEEEPKALREESLLPLEVATVEQLRIDGGEQTVQLARSEDGGFVFKQPELGQADETLVEGFLSKLKERKVGRFLAAGEEAPMGEVQVRYAADLSYSDFGRVTELHQRVGVQPKLLYGRRYLLDPKSGQPVEGTVERFVVEIPPESDIVSPTPGLFEDRRVLKLDIDKVKGVTLSRDGQTVVAEKDAMGRWRVAEGDGSAEAVNGLVFTLKDLRFEEERQGVEEPPSGSLTLRLRSDTGDVELRLVQPESGKPYLWRDSQALLLSDSSSATLAESVAKVLKNASNE